MRRVALFILGVALSGVAAAATITGKVVAIADGDTLTLLTSGRQQIKVRLAEIDTPERGQPYGTRARQTLAELAFSKQATVETREKDRYGRLIGRVYVAGTDVNRELVRRGAAWVYRQYNRDRSLLAVEAEARAANRGLWALPETDRVAPWNWRKGTKHEIAQPYAGNQALNDAAARRFSCSPRKTCAQMTSCAEARFHLNQCDNGRLDRDGDGTPCASICP